MISKLQELLDASGTKVAEREPQQPSEAFLERQKQFLQRESRLIELRKTRLASDAPAPRLSTYDIVRHNGAWRILYLGRHSSGFDGQQAAIAAAVEKAKGQAAKGREVRVRLNRTDGQVWPVDLETGSAIAPAVGQ